MKSEAAICSIPAYCLKSIGCRHIIVGGGGGSAKTGVPNQLQLFLLNYGSSFGVKSNKFGATGPINAHLTGTVETGEFANMNMDCMALGNEPEKGQYLIAVGQDEFCTLYETVGFEIAVAEDGTTDLLHHLERSPALALDFRALVRVQTDNHPGEDSYQNCVRLFRSQNDNQLLKMLTAGTDGYVRLWKVASLLKNLKSPPDRGGEDGGETAEIPTRRDVTPELEICTGSGIIEDLDISPCGQFLATIHPHQAFLWNLANYGAKIMAIEDKPEGEGAAAKKFKVGQVNGRVEQWVRVEVRSLRFTGLDRTGKSAVFVAAHNQRVRSSKEVSHLSLCVLDKEHNNYHVVQRKQAYNESISCLQVSECGKFSAIGTMGGSVAVFDTQTLAMLVQFRETHRSFVTSLSFLPQRAYDIKDLGRIGEQQQGSIANLPAGRCFLPGICANSLAALVSISVDRTIQVHQVPFPSGPSFSGTLFRLSFLCMLVYAFLWALLKWT